MKLESGATVAERFRLEQELGRGGVGVVWAARHTITGRRVALKFVQQPAHARDVVQRRFVLEARAATALDHPHAVSVLDVLAVDEATLVMVMEWLDGETLGEVLRREDTLSVEKAARLLLPVVSAVGTAHQLGIVHRDLKPDNIFIDKRQGVKVLDFGLAKLMTEDEGVTQTGAMVGTPAYMPPEQGSGDATIDHRADVWALGAILFEGLTGGRPIEGQTVAQVVRRLLEDGIPPLETVAPHVPDDLARLVNRMLARDAEDRLPDLRSAAEVLSKHTDLEAPSFGPPGSVSPELDLDELAPPASGRSLPEPTLTTPGPETLERRPPPPARTWYWVAAVAVLAGVSVWSLASSTEPQPPGSAPARADSTSLPAAEQPPSSHAAQDESAPPPATVSPPPSATVAASTSSSTAHPDAPPAPRPVNAARPSPVPTPESVAAPTATDESDDVPAPSQPLAAPAPPSQPSHKGGLRLDPPF